MKEIEFDFAHRGVTMVNVFTVKPENQAKLLAALKHEAETVMRRQPGYRYSVVHRSIDGQRIVNYTLWASKEAFEASHRDPDYVRLRKENGPLLESADQHLYEIEFALRSDDA